MRDLRRRALESNKTVSRKARERIPSAASSKASSRLNSPAQSRAPSRDPSRHGSDEDDYLSEGTAWSTNSIDDLLNGDDDGASAEAWKTELHTRIEQIVDRKRSSVEGRTESLNAYAHILMARYAQDEIQGHMSELLPSILRPIRFESSERETATALKALAVTIVTLDADDMYDSVAGQLKRTIADSESIQIKVGALHALSIAALFGGASEEEMLDIMTYLLDIVESDGLSIDAHDEGSVVTAALEGWGLLATEVEDLQEATEAAIEAFVDQLESSDPQVQIAAGENIALSYEKSYTPLEADDEIPEEDQDSDSEGGHGDKPKLVKRYDVYRRGDQLLHTLDDLANISSRSISKKARKTLHSSFADIRNSVENPARGPKYSSAINHLTGMPYGGGRMSFAINNSAEVRIDKWWKLLRLNALRRTLQGGFKLHYNENEAVSNFLPQD